MFTRPNGDAVLHFKIYDGYGHCIETFTGTMQEFQQRAPVVALMAAPTPPRDQQLLLN